MARIFKPRADGSTDFEVNGPQRKFWLFRLLGAFTRPPRVTVDVNNSNRNTTRGTIHRNSPAHQRGKGRGK